jgi:hypothetical protein
MASRPEKKSSRLCHWLSARNTVGSDEVCNVYGLVSHDKL